MTGITAATATADNAKVKMTSQQLEPLLKNIFGIEDCKGLFNPERMLTFANAVLDAAVPAPVSAQAADAPPADVLPDFPATGADTWMFAVVSEAVAAHVPGEPNEALVKAIVRDVQALRRHEASQQVATEVVDPAARINVKGFDYPTTYGELATLPAEKLWNRFKMGRALDAREAFLVARAIPFVRQEVVEVRTDAHKVELATLARVYEVVGLGEQARTPAILLTNIENALRRNECLSRVESILTVTRMEEGEEVEDCAMKWGAEPAEYADQFRAALVSYVRVPVGYKVVPLKPTIEQEQAGFDIAGAHMYSASYRAMVEAYVPPAVPPLNFPRLWAALRKADSVVVATTSNGEYLPQVYGNAEKFDIVELAPLQVASHPENVAPTLADIRVPVMVEGLKLVVFDVPGEDGKPLASFVIGDGRAAAFHKENFLPNHLENLYRLVGSHEAADDVAMETCSTCEGTQRISPVEWCERCNRSGILPARPGSAPEKQSEEPVARLHIRLDDAGLSAEVEVLNGTYLQVSDSPVDVYLAPWAGVSQEIDPRTTFEAYAKHNGWHLERAADSYRSDDTSEAWRVWRDALQALLAGGAAPMQALRIIHDTFKRDLEQGYRSKDKQFAVDIAGRVIRAEKQAGA